MNFVIWLLLYGFNFSVSEADNTTLATGIYPISEVETPIQKYCSCDQDTHYLVMAPIISLERFASVKIEKSDGEYYGLTVVLDETGKQQLTEASSVNQGLKWAFIINDVLWSVATVYHPITEGAFTITSGSYTKKELQPVKQQIEKDMAALKPNE